MRLVDLLLNRGPTLPNDSKLAVVEFGRIATDQYNITQLVMGTQQGTHLDKMFHFFDDGRTLDQMPLEKDVSVRAIVHFKEQSNLTYDAAPSTGLDIPKRSSRQVTVYSSHDLPRPFGSRANRKEPCTTGSNHELIYSRLKVDPGILRHGANEIGVLSNTEHPELKSVVWPCPDRANQERNKPGSGRSPRRGPR